MWSKSDFSNHKLLLERTQKTKKISTIWTCITIKYNLLFCLCVCFSELKEPTIEPSRSQLDLWRALYAPVDCHNCGSSFEPQSFVVHQQNCFFFAKKLSVSKKQSIPNESHRPCTTPNGTITSRSDSSKIYANPGGKLFVSENFPDQFGLFN